MLLSASVNHQLVAPQKMKLVSGKDIPSCILPGHLNYCNYDNGQQLSRHWIVYSEQNTYFFKKKLREFSSRKFFYRYHNIFVNSLLLFFIFGYDWKIILHKKIAIFPRLLYICPFILFCACTGQFLLSIFLFFSNKQIFSDFTRLLW